MRTAAPRQFSSRAPIAREWSSGESFGRPQTLSYRRVGGVKQRQRFGWRLRSSATRMTARAVLHAARPCST